MNKALIITAVLVLGIISIPSVHVFAADKTVECTTKCTFSFKGKTSMDVIVNGGSGSQGPAGPQGPPGVDGKDGINGKDGVNGTDGQQGPQGEVGPQGEQGIQGVPGINGTDGKDAQLDENQSTALNFVIQNQDALKAIVDLYNNGSLGLVNVTNSTQ